MVDKDIDVKDPNVDDEDTSSNVNIEEIQNPFSPSDIEIKTPPMNMGDLIDWISDGWINFGTEYQREQNLWSDDKQSLLIESILLGLRLPAFYFEEVNKRKYNIIDGLQRCCAIKNFCVDNTLALNKLEFLGNDFMGKHYGDFQFATKTDIRMLPITVNILEKGTPDDVKYILFRRLNTGGIELTSQEIRNAVFIGPAIDTVDEMAKSDEFIMATEGKIKTLRKQDMDFVSRFIAFYLTDYNDYKPDLDSFINTGMKLLKDGKVDVDKMKSDFRRSMNLAIDIFGDRAFRKQTSEEEPRRPLNKAVFEVISVLLAKLSDSDATKLLAAKDDFKQKFWNVMGKDQTFNNSFSDGTGMKTSVTKRFSTVQNIINQLIA